VVAVLTDLPHQKRFLEIIAGVITNLERELFLCQE